MSQHVTTTLKDGFAVIALDSPPVNALSAGLRRELHVALSEISRKDDVRGVVLTGSGRNFIAGADVSELGTPPVEPTVATIIALLESFPQPTVAAINGNALGGGLEIAMACHYRVAMRSAKLGLPEVRLGLIPGAGGTQKLPRLVGPARALDMIMSAQVIDAGAALEAGLVDAVCDDDLLAAAIAFAKARSASEHRHVPVKNRDEKLSSAAEDLGAFDAQAARLLAKSRGLQAAEFAVQSVRDTLTVPFAEGLANERRRFLDLAGSEQFKALRHLFFAERDAAKIDTPGSRQPAEVAKVAVIGAGTMGRGIAMAFLNANFPVRLVEADEQGLERGLKAIADTYQASVRRGSLSKSAMAERIGRLAGSLDYSVLSDCDLVIEAVFEDMALKKTIFKLLEANTRPGTIIATNTSYLDVDEIAASTSRPENVLGLHFFSPANIMKLLEIVRGARTSENAIAAALKTAKRIGKIPVVVGVGYGFVGNRMLASRAADLERLMLEGASPQQIDEAFKRFGWPMGPFEMTDLAGLDVGWRNRKAHGKVAPIADALCEQGRFGQKTGRGFYLYSEGAHKGTADPAVIDLIRHMAEERAVAQREVSEEEIIERTHYPLVNAGWQVLEEGIARSASDIDVIWVNGYGFPPTKGGPMYWSERQGVDHIKQRLAALYSLTGLDYFKVGS